MENFFFNDEFMSDIDSLLHQIGIDEDDVSSLPDDWSKECFESEERPIVKLSADYILRMIDEGNFSENGYDDESAKIAAILNENIDWKKINELIPTLFYPTRNKFYITKADLMLHYA